MSIIAFDVGSIVPLIIWSLNAESPSDIALTTTRIED